MGLGMKVMQVYGYNQMESYNRYTDIMITILGECTDILLYF